MGAVGSFLWVMPRIKREYREEGHLLEPTVGMVYTAYGLHLAAFSLAVSECQPQRKKPVLSVLGWSAAGLGTALFAAGWRTLPVSDDSALTTSGLKTGGAYQLSRNPQNVGWAVTLLDVSLARRSGAGAGLAGLFWLAFTAYLPTEEAFLEQTYGPPYREYMTRTSRFLGRASQP